MQITSVRKSGRKAPTWDIEVHDKHCYQLENGVLSHNTIGLVMDCDTTGIEPDFALVKHKGLAGGGSMRIVNQSVEEALRALGYDALTAIVIKTYVHENGSIEGAPDLLDRDLAVFDCAVSQPNRRTISVDGHLKMMAAAQPFVSGAISKTVNMPSESTVADVLKAYAYAWNLGIKAIAVYRDGSKLSQPLSGAFAVLAEEAPEVSPNTRAATITEQHSGESPLDYLSVLDAIQKAGIYVPARPLQDSTSSEEKPKREKLPSARRGTTRKATVGGQGIYVRSGEYPDGRLGEIFLDLAKEGASLRSIMNCFAVAVSLGLQYGVPLEEFVEAFTFTRFEPSGLVQGHERIKNATSILDYVFRELAIAYLGRNDLAHVALEHTVSNTQDEKIQEAKRTEAVKPDAPDSEKLRMMGYTGDACLACGNFQMTRNGTCLKCNACGETTGCS